MEEGRGCRGREFRRVEKDGTPPQIQQLKRASHWSECPHGLLNPLNAAPARRPQGLETNTKALERPGLVPVDFSAQAECSSFPHFRKLLPLMGFSTYVLSTPGNTESSVTPRAKSYQIAGKPSRLSSSL